MPAVNLTTLNSNYEFETTELNSEIHSCWTYLSLACSVCKLSQDISCQRIKLTFSSVKTIASFHINAETDGAHLSSSPLLLSEVA